MTDNMRSNSSDVRASLQDDDVHQEWVSAFRTPASDAFYETAFDLLAAEFGTGSGPILDVGCGTGVHSLRLARRGLDVIGVDLASPALGRAMSAIDEVGMKERVRFHYADVTKLPYSTASFRGVLCWGVLMHVPDVLSALDELGRVMRSGGVLVMNEVNGRSPEARAFWVLKRLTKKGVPGIGGSLGIEYWNRTKDSVLLTRYLDMGRFVKEVQMRGFRLRYRRAAQLTQLYTRLPAAPARILHALNRFWFRYGRKGGPAFTNVLVFEKVRDEPVPAMDGIPRIDRDV